MTRFAAMVVLAPLVAVSCGSPPASPPTASPPASPTVGPSPLAPSVSTCAPFEARASVIAASVGGCSTDTDCACRSGLLFSDCGEATTADVARRLDTVLRDAAAAGCVPGGPRCAPRACTARCVAGRCVE